MGPKKNSAGTNALPRVRDNEWIVGRLLDHGPAKYQFDDTNSLSYYVRLRIEENEQGARRRVEDEKRMRPGIDGQDRPHRRTADDGGNRILWGADLKRAIEHSQSHVKVGQVVAARLIGREPLQVKGKVGSRPANSQIPKYRNRWEIESPQFIVERSKVARKILDNPVEARREGKSHPELAGTYLALRGAEMIAKHRYPHPDDQKKFVDRVREALAASAERAVPLSATRRSREAKHESAGPAPHEPLTRE